VKLVRRITIYYTDIAEDFVDVDPGWLYMTGRALEHDMDGKGFHINCDSGQPIEYKVDCQYAPISLETTNKFPTSPY
jgi:hypothetical protein